MGKQINKEFGIPTESYLFKGEKSKNREFTSPCPADTTNLYD